METLRQMPYLHGRMYARDGRVVLGVYTDVSWENAASILIRCGT